MGVEIRTNTEITSVADLKAQGYDAVILAIGAGKPGTLRGADMQQNLRFPAQCTVIPAEELEQVSGGAPAWVGELKDQIRPSGIRSSRC